MLAGAEEALQNEMTHVPASLRALMSGLIDYAGLFPPAALDMKTAVANYARYLAGPDAWALGRFVLPVARFAEFEAVIADLHPVEPWGISALVGTNHEMDLAEVDRFNHRNIGKARIDSVEAKAATVDEICQVRAFVRGTMTPYFEIPPEKAADLLGTLHDIRGRAKIRTGGITVDTFPSADQVANFIFLCAENKVAFKATAGLHHPLRCVKPLTDSPGAPKGTMHGFLNLFLAASSAYAGHETFPTLPRILSELLNAEQPRIVFNGEFASIEAHFPQKGASVQTNVETKITAQTIRAARQNFAISFGSCSFEEPLADLRELKLL
jgi:hypothetical protein